jgi:hypothetical protein
MQAFTIASGGGLRDKFLLELTQEARGSIEKAVALLSARGHLSKRLLIELHRVLRPASAALGCDGGLFPPNLAAVRKHLAELMLGVSIDNIEGIHYTAEVCKGLPRSFSNTASGSDLHTTNPPLPLP